ncbi:MAG: hypothetical protein ACAI43_16090 [Phycisphaerae bacterium]|nr:hypothetical protein [Tepidisphaeraceae bacterium]
MSAKLTNDDRCVVDLLLDRPTQTGGHLPTTCFTTAPSAHLEQRLARVEQLLHSLDAFVAAEPSNDLLARTLARCQASDVMANTPAAIRESVAARHHA